MIFIVLSQLSLDVDFRAAAGGPAGCNLSRLQSGTRLGVAYFAMVARVAQARAVNEIAPFASIGRRSRIATFVRPEFAAMRGTRARPDGSTGRHTARRGPHAPRCRTLVCCPWSNPSSSRPVQSACTLAARDSAPAGGVLTDLCGKLFGRTAHGIMSNHLSSSRRRGREGRHS